MKKIFAFIIGIFLFSGSFMLNGCGCSYNGGDEGYTDNILLQYFDETMPVGSVEFTESILNEENLERITPLGQINPPGHTFPTDHIYFLTIGLYPPVYAPSDGKILFIEEAGMYGDGAIRIAVSSTMTYYLGHIFVDEDLQVGDTIEAGEQVGISGNTSCVDFGLLNKDIDNGFLNQKMPLTTLYGDKPLLYYCEPLRTELYSMVKPPQSSSIIYGLNSNNLYIKIFSFRLP